MRSFSSVTNNEKPLLNNVQALRGIAALMVCTLHFRFAVHNHFYQELLKNGGIGVQIFFMISGFIMVHTTRTISLNSILESKEFLLRRIIRIVPLYYFATLFFIADNINDGYLIQNWKLLVTSLLFLSPLSVPIGPDYGPPCLEVGWTLNYEMLFYMLFTVSILFGKFRYQFIYLTFFSLLIVIPLVIKGSLSPNYSTYQVYNFAYLNILTNPILLHFLFGVTLGLVVPKIKISTSAVRWMLWFSIVFFLCYYLDVFQIPINAITDLLCCGFLVTAVILNDYHPEGVKFPALLVAPGNYSYSLYLLHPIVIAYLQLGFNRMGMESVVQSTMFFFIAIAFTLLISWITYLIIEKKFTGFLKSKLSF